MRVRRVIGIVFCALIVAQNSYALEYEDYPLVKLRSLDKITARTMTYEAKVGSTLKFGDLFIKIQSCRKPPPVEKSEAAAFLQIWQQGDAAKKDVKPSSWIFSGWMFASSPSLSGMDHPVYDVWVVDCAGRDPEPIPEPTPVPEVATEDQVTDETGAQPSDSTAQETPQESAPTDTDTTAVSPSAASESPAETEEAVTEKPVPAPQAEPEPAPAMTPREDKSSSPPSPSFEGIY
jgi:hypothetical protein